MCKACISATQCISCISDAYEINSTGLCNLKCSTGYYPLYGQCLPCFNLCANCSQSVCFNCMEAASIGQNNLCTCDLGYSGTTQCVRNYFNASINVTNTLVRVTFSEELKNILSTGNFSVFVYNQVSFSYVFTAENNQSYTFKITPHTSVPKGTTVQIQIADSQVSLKNSLLSNYYLLGTLQTFVVPNPSTAAVMNSTAAVTKGIVASSVAAGVFCNPSLL